MEEHEAGIDAGSDEELKLGGHKLEVYRRGDVLNARYQQVAGEEMLDFFFPVRFSATGFCFLGMPSHIHLPILAILMLPSRRLDIHLPKLIKLVGLLMRIAIGWDFGCQT
jgi:hypothetical protein